MDIETTINISESNFRKIENLSNTYNISKNKIALLFLEKRIHYYSQSKKPTVFSRIRYQKRDSANVWEQLHVYLAPHLYESCLDLRKLFKMSVSFIIAEAIDTYYDDIVKILTQAEGHDNYVQNYVYLFKIVDNILSYTIYWGYPGEEELAKHMYSP